MRTHIHVNIAYTALFLFDYSTCISSSRIVLDTITAPVSLRFLSVIYNAEAFLKLGLVQETIDLLSPMNTVIYETAFGAGEETLWKSPYLEKSHWFVYEVPKALLYLNLAVAFTIAGFQEKAYEVSVVRTIAVHLPRSSIASQGQADSFASDSSCRVP